MSVRTRTFGSWFSTDHGRFDEAEESAREAMRVANAMQQPFSQLLANMAVGYCLFRRGRLDEACDVLEKGYGICRSGAILSLDGFISGWFAAVLVRLGRTEEARRIVQRAIELDLGRYCGVAGAYYVQDANARVLASVGRSREAMAEVDRAVATVLSVQDPVHYAYALFSRGELKLNLDIDRDTAAQDILWARRRARRLGMTHLEAECERALHVCG